MPTIYVLSKNKKNIKIFLAKFSFFTTEKNLCILHGQVFVTFTDFPNMHVIFLMVMVLISSGADVFVDGAYKCIWTYTDPTDCESDCEDK